MNQHSAN
jgi:hypothetical protein